MIDIRVLLSHIEHSTCFSVIPVAVSYTHLDVYKRQVQGFAKILANRLNKAEENIIGDYQRGSRMDKSTIDMLRQIL